MQTHWDASSALCGWVLLAVHEQENLHLSSLALGLLEQGGNNVGCLYKNSRRNASQKGKGAEGIRAAEHTARHPKSPFIPDVQHCADGHVAQGLRHIK